MELYSILSYQFVINFVVRQGSVWSPFLFGVYLDDIWINQQISPSYYITIYADDILLISSFICELQRTVYVTFVKTKKNYRKQIARQLLKH